MSLGQEAVQWRDELSMNNSLQDILGPSGITICPEELLELKSVFGFSWKKLRRLKSWLRERQIRTADEGRVRNLHEEIIRDNLIGEYVPMQVTCESSRNVEIQQAPLVYVKDVKSLVYEMLNEYEQLDELTWHNGSIPEEEVWVKVGGDKGGGTFKLMVQLANVGRPNSLHNTRVILLFPGNDSPYNLQVALKSVQAQIEELSHSHWREKKIRLFVFGDYEYLTRMYGLSGPSGRHCCLHCSVTRQDMAIPPAERKAPQQARTLESLDISLSKFKQHSIAKEAFNVIRPPFFQIPIDQVCPPGLHISLGLFLKHFNSMSERCHGIDVKIMEKLAVRGEELSHARTAYKQAMRKFSLQNKAKELEEEIDDLIQQHTMVALLYDTEPPATILEMADEKRKEKREVVIFHDMMRAMK
ncbi:uncharacterized protein [Diadema setosum]|uniref:uncharacterized protein n=1 Tax=Diadema setosum TaxID=31175 RepID=UPI003B3B098B